MAIEKSELMRRLRAERKAAGLVKTEVWTKLSDKPELLKLVAKLNEAK